MAIENERLKEGIVRPEPFYFLLIRKQARHWLRWHHGHRASCECVRDPWVTSWVRVFFTGWQSNGDPQIDESRLHKFTRIRAFMVRYENLEVWMSSPVFVWFFLRVDEKVISQLQGWEALSFLVTNSPPTCVMEKHYRSPMKILQIVWRSRSKWCVRIPHFFFFFFCNLLEGRADTVFDAPSSILRTQTKFTTNERSPVIAQIPNSNWLSRDSLNEKKKKFFFVVVAIFVDLLLRWKQGPLL